MMVLPELDTYGIVRKYAEHPGDTAVTCAFLMLVKRAKRCINWELHDLIGYGIPYKDGLALRLGSSQLGASDKPGSSEPDSQAINLNDLSNMSEADVKKTYMSLLKATGFKQYMDPGGSMSDDNNNT